MIRETRYEERQRKENELYDLIMDLWRCGPLEELEQEDKMYRDNGKDR